MLVALVARSDIWCANLHRFSFPDRAFFGQGANFLAQSRIFGAKPPSTARSAEASKSFGVSRIQPLGNDKYDLWGMRRFLFGV